MPKHYRKKPLAQFEHGTRIYAPSQGERRFRVVTTDPTSGERIFVKCGTEDGARFKARELEQFIALMAPIRDKPEDGPRTVARLAAAYRDDHLSGLSLMFQEKQSSTLRNWILPLIGQRIVVAWTPADSARVIASARRSGVSDALVQDIGATMRALVTHARRMRWLTSQSEDPMWMVRYSKTATIQGASALYVPRSGLPTDEQCAALFAAMEDQGNRRWAIAMRLVHRAGLRWSELTALQARDVEIEPVRIVHVRRAVDQGSRGALQLKRPKNGRERTTIFPKSLVGDLRECVEDADARGGPDALLFPSPNGEIARRTNFQRTWIQAADAAGWPMTSPLRRSNGYGQKNKGWRWTGSALWSPHDLRHVAACWMLFDLGLDPAVVADKLGHADPAFTMKRYVGVRGDADAAAMSVTDSW